MPTLRTWSEGHILQVMRAWRRGCGPLTPWFRATPFAAALQYRDRSLAVRCPEEPGAARRLATVLPRPTRSRLWIFDLPGPLGLWLAWELRRRWGHSAALAWNGWYDPRGLLDGHSEISILLALGRRLACTSITAGACLLFDSNRHAGNAGPHVLDNRYRLNEEDAPSAEQLAGMGIVQVSAFSWHLAADDLKAYLDHVRSRLPVALTDDLALKMAHG
ncbi:MAG TPA: hypothetical protein VMS64_28835 [Candidatus Methylomirabilis sp.]|nr:hypothetical protein [Candidatus Methylomirabilis sp.]